LNCQHTFCLTCISNWANTLKKQDAVECPLCREETRFNGRSIEVALKPNYVAIGILDKMKNQSQKEMCDFHENEKGVIYCKTCKKNICINCVLTSTHHSHEKIKIEDAKLEIQLTNQNFIEKAKKRRSSSDENLSVQLANTVQPVQPVNPVNPVQLANTVQPVQTVQLANPVQQVNTTTPIQRVTDIELDDATREIIKLKYDDDERYGVYHTEEDKMRIINEAKKKKKRRSNQLSQRSQQGQLIQPSQQGQLNQLIQPSRLSQPSQSNQLSQRSQQGQLNQLSQRSQISRRSQRSRHRNKRSNSNAVVIRQHNMEISSTIDWNDDSYRAVRHDMILRPTFEKVYNFAVSFLAQKGLSPDEYEFELILKQMAVIVARCDEIINIGSASYGVYRQVEDVTKLIQLWQHQTVGVLKKLSFHAARMGQSDVHYSIVNLVSVIADKTSKLNERYLQVNKINQLAIQCKQLMEEFNIQLSNEDVDIGKQFRMLQ